MGDHPATLPATIPVAIIAAAGPKPEFDRDLGAFRAGDFRESGVRGGCVPADSLCSLVGVWGGELVLDGERDEPFLDLDRGNSVSTGCCSLYLSTLSLPPRSFFMNVN